MATPHIAAIARNYARVSKRVMRTVRAKGWTSEDAQFEADFIKTAENLGKAIDANPCAFSGHVFGDIGYVSPAVLVCCHRCGRDILGRDFGDLEPMTQEDRDFLEEMERMGDL